REIASFLPEDLADVENHRETLARALCVPEHTELALQFVAAKERFVRAIHADELVVLGDDLVFVLVAEDEVLNVIQQSLRWEEPGDHAFQARALLLDRLAVNFLFL